MSGAATKKPFFLQSGKEETFSAAVHFRGVLCGNKKCWKKDFVGREIWAAINPAQLNPKT